MIQTQENSNNLQIPSYTEELVPLFEYPDLSPKSRVSLVGLIDRIGPTLRFGHEPSISDYEYAEPRMIEEGLYVSRSDSDYPKGSDQHVVYLGLTRGRGSASHDLDKVSYGVAFQPVEFKVIARNARDLGRHTEVNTRAARWQQPDRDESEAAAMRAAGHVLQGKINGMDALTQRLQADNSIIKHLIRHLINPDRYRTRVSKLDAERTFGVEKIHDTAEVAGIYLSLSNSAIAGLHRVIKKRTYNGNYSNNERSANLINYLWMVGLHNRAKIYKANLYRDSSVQELESKYMHYLQAKENTLDGQTA